MRKVLAIVIAAVAVLAFTAKAVVPNASQAVKARNAQIEAALS